MSTIKNTTKIFADKGTLYNPPILLIPPKDGIYFGKFCSIAPNLKVIGTNHDYNFPSVQLTFYDKYFNITHPISTTSNISSKGKVIIGNDVWIGEDVVILSGINIGDGCCIGARSIITKDLQPYTICVGTPCKSVKLRFNQDIIDFLLKLKWWNWDDEKIKRNKVFFTTDLNKFDLDHIKQLIVD